MFLLLESLVCFMCVLWSLYFLYFVYRFWYHYLRVYLCLLHFRLCGVCLFFWYPWGYLWEYHDVRPWMLCSFIYIGIPLWSAFFWTYFSKVILVVESTMSSFSIFMLTFFFVSGVVLKQFPILLAWTHVCVAAWCCVCCCVACVASWCPSWLLHQSFGRGASFIACNDPLPQRKGCHAHWLEPAKVRARRIRVLHK